MLLKTFINDALLTEEAREDFASRCGSSIGYLRNISYGQRKCSPVLAVAIERETGGAVTRQELRPKDWRETWPELAERV